MKKAILLVVALFMTSALFAQEMSQEAKNYRAAVKTFLTSEGYSPYIDDDDESLCFKKEGTLYWIFFESQSPVYVEFHGEGFNGDGVDRNAALKAVNELNRTKRCVKGMVTTKGGISLSIEFFSSSPDQFKKTFNSNLNALVGAKETVKDKYQEYK
ncbi:MAG: hypothetical protein IKS00_06515 [Bacteroidales bacterium]|nr:hypothetical protein [Bacteroidales bacterium]